MTIGQPPLFEATGLMLSVPGRVLIRDLHWRVEPGERWCVIGRNGAGKSTLLRSMAGVQDLMNHYGSLCWRGQDIALIPSEDLAHLRAYAEQTPTGAIGMRAIDFVYAGLWAADRSLDEALALPTKEAATIALRTCAKNSRQISPVTISSSQTASRRVSTARSMT